VSRVHNNVLLIVALAAIVLTGTVLAEIKTRVEPRLVEEMDTVRLTLRALGHTNSDPLDLSALEAEFEVLGSNTQSKFRSINGNVESSVEYQISLRPRRTGELLVPSIAIGNELSEAVQIVVREMDPGIKQTIERMVFFETELSANPVYVQAETILKRRLYYSNGVQIYSDLPGAPEIPDAVVIPLGDTQSRSTTLDGKRYGVIEQQFAIFPEHSGTLIIPQISITSSVRVNSGGRSRRSGFRIGTSEERIEVLPIPAEYPRDKPWLPASDVRINETWSPDGTSFKVGEQLFRNLSVIAIGNTGSAIGPLGIEFSEEHFKWYPEAPSLDDDNKGRQIVGTRIEGYSLIPVLPGTASLTTVSVTWWDTTADQLRVARLPPGSLTITGSVLPPAPVTTDPEPTPEPAAVAVDTRPDNWSTSTASLLGLSAVALVALALLIGRWLGARQKNRPLQHTEHPGQKPSARMAFRALKHACSDNDPRQIRTALVTFLNASSDDPRPLSLFLAEPDHAKVWRQLDEALYGETGATPVDAAGVLQAARAFRKRPPVSDDDPLPALFS